jgi:hypothetical protein
MIVLLRAVNGRGEHWGEEMKVVLKVTFGDRLAQPEDCSISGGQIKASSGQGSTERSPPNHGPVSRPLSWSFRQVSGPLSTCSNVRVWLLHVPERSVSEKGRKAGSKDLLDERML